jgi:Tfp pilus assembly protein PilO
MVRRQKLFYFIGALLAVLLIVNVLFFVIVFNTAASEASRLDTAIKELTAANKIKAVQVKSLQETADALESFPGDRNSFLSHHLVKRQTGFADILRRLDRMVETSGVRKTRVEYSVPAPIAQYGLHLVKVTIPVQGEYSAIFKFIKELQTAPTLFIVTAIEVHGAATGEDVEEESTISLNLAMETYFYDER